MKEVRILSAITAVSLCLAFASANRLAGAEETLEQRLKAHVALMASRDLAGRRPGTEGARLAAEYILGRFKEAGLAPGARDGTYLQSVPVKKAVMPGRSCRLSFRKGAELAELAEFEEFIPLGFSGSGEVAGELAFAGFGRTDEAADWDDYSHVDARGKVVLVATRAGRILEKAENAERHGASGVIIACDPGLRDDGQGYWEYLKMPERMIGIPCVLARGSAIEKAFARIREVSLAGMIAEIDSKGEPVSSVFPGIEAKLAVDVIRGKDACSNVIGLLEGSDPDIKGQCVVLCAHFDHLGFGDSMPRGNKPGEFYPGADDNASGVAVMLELAREFGSMKPRPRRSVLFITFTAEEGGSNGSRTYVSNPAVPLADTAAVVNLEMLGRLRESKLFAMCVNQGGVFDTVIREANKDSQFGLITPANDQGCSSDHRSFLERKVPAMVVSACGWKWVHPDCHRPGDTPDKLDYEGMARISAFVSRVLKALADSDERQDTAAGIPGGPIGDRTPYPYADSDSATQFPGFAWDSGHEGKGARIQKTGEGSWADKAGFRRGDVVISIAGKPVDSPMAAFSVLDALVRKGTEDPIGETVILRGGGQMKLDCGPLFVYARHKAWKIARMSAPGWKLAGFDDSKWTHPISGFPLSPSRYPQFAPAVVFGIDTDACWLWSAEPPPHGMNSVYFRSEAAAPADCGRAEMILIADDHAEVCINGIPAVSCGTRTGFWGARGCARVADVHAFLDPGKNTIAAFAIDSGVCYGMCMELRTGRKPVVEELLNQSEPAEGPRFGQCPEGALRKIWSESDSGGRNVACVLRAMAGLAATDRQAVVDMLSRALESDFEEVVRDAASAASLLGLPEVLPAVLKATEARHEARTMLALVSAARKLGGRDCAPRLEALSGKLPTAKDEPPDSEEALASARLGKYLKTTIESLRKR